MLVTEYIKAKIPVVVPDNTIEAIMADRGVSLLEQHSTQSRRTLDLLYADMLMYLSNKPYMVTAETRKHGSFSHTRGGERFSNLSNFRSTANSIYKKYGDSRYSGLAANKNITDLW